jgi:hypothetical protein
MKRSVSPVVEMGGITIYAYSFCGAPLVQVLALPCLKSLRNKNQGASSNWTTWWDREVSLPGGISAGVKPLFPRFFA